MVINTCVMGIILTFIRSLCLRIKELLYKERHPFANDGFNLYGYKVFNLVTVQLTILEEISLYILGCQTM